MRLNKLNTLHKIGKYYGRAVHKGAQDIDNPVAAMRKDILATILPSNNHGKKKQSRSHFPTDEKTWCFFNKAIIIKNKKSGKN